jgi:hypothetical protein
MARINGIWVLVWVLVAGWKIQKSIGSRLVLVINSLQPIRIDQRSIDQGELGGFGSDFPRETDEIKSDAQRVLWASQARHEYVSPYKTFASRIVV